MSFTTYTVAPVPGGKRWRVLADGREVSKHNAKTNAIQKAKKLADRNDSITVMNKGGQFQRRIRG